jgi:hypothetical protein
MLGTCGMTDMHVQQACESIVRHAGGHLRHFIRTGLFAALAKLNPLWTHASCFFVVVVVTVSGKERIEGRNV